jgi:alkaline phosphatase D
MKNRHSFGFIVLGLTIMALLLQMQCSLLKPSGDAFTCQWPENITRTWIGPEYWANPLQDWQIRNGRLECISSGGDRNVFLLTHELTGEPKPFSMSVIFGRLEEDTESLEEGWIGFKTGIRGEFNDYRDSAVRGDGYRLGMTTRGRLFIGSLDTATVPVPPPFQNIRLYLDIRPQDEDYLAILSAYDKDGQLLSEIQRTVPSDWLNGGVALVCNHGQLIDMPDTRHPIDHPTWDAKPGTERKGNMRFWFNDWTLSGRKVRNHRNRTFGPILFTQYTLSRSIFKMTAQMVPVSEMDGKTVRLQIRKAGKWQTLDEAEIHPLACTATFRVEEWDGSRDTKYRIVYNLFTLDGLRAHYFAGTIRREPWDKEELVIAGFTGNNDLGFPNSDMVSYLHHHDPDLLFFSGDQIYEGVAGYGIQTSPPDKACLDYLRKWFLYGWAYRDLMKDRPTVAIPDDHDVYHGNLWGAGGIATPPGLTGAKAQDQGGFKMTPDWVNMVQRTQTSHLPDPFDPTPVQQGITTYYCSMNYAGISFAVLEDRKFKSAPGPLLPQAEVWNGWPQNTQFDVIREGDVKGAVLLGDRQLKFLSHWSADWSDNTWMKVVLSQTIFANLATLPNGTRSDAVVPSLKIFQPGEYPEDDQPVQDLDSNGWPQTGRNKALHEMRKGFAFHLAGDQHLGSTIQYGIDEWRDASFAFCVPAVSNVWPRRWFPAAPGQNHQPGTPKYTGDFWDGFGNRITVHAVSNPYFTGLNPSKLYDRATGYGIVRINRKNRSFVCEAWPRWTDPSNPDARPYPDWPVTFHQLDNYGRKPTAFLPTIHVKGMDDPVVQIVDDSREEIVYTLRIQGNTFRPPVFTEGRYTIRIGDPDRSIMKTFPDIQAYSIEVDGALHVDFPKIK